MKQDFKISFYEIFLHFECKIKFIQEYKFNIRVTTERSEKKNPKCMKINILRNTHKTLLIKKIFS